MDSVTPCRSRALVLELQVPAPCKEDDGLPVASNVERPYTSRNQSISLRVIIDRHRRLAELEYLAARHIVDHA